MHWAQYLESPLVQASSLLALPAILSSKFHITDSTATASPVLQRQPSICFRQFVSKQHSGDSEDAPADILYENEATTAPVRTGE